MNSVTHTIRSEINILCYNIVKEKKKAKIKNLFRYSCIIKIKLTSYLKKLLAETQVTKYYVISYQLVLTIFRCKKIPMDSQYIWIPKT